MLQYSTVTKAQFVHLNFPIKTLNYYLLATYKILSYIAIYKIDRYVTTCIQVWLHDAVHSPPAHLTEHNKYNGNNYVNKLCIK